MKGKVLGVREIKSILPHRYPLLMLDRVELLGECQAVAIKNLTVNELFFQGHFPNHPIMPGVLQLEAMRQLGELLTRPTLDPTGSADVYMRIAEKVKFRKPVNPGDRLKIEVEVLEYGDNDAVIKATTSTNSGVSCEAKITLSVRMRDYERSMPELYNEFDKHAGTPMDVNEIMALVPHRYPFLLIDHLSVIEADRVVAVKNVSVNEEIFSCSYEDYSVLPESLQCEIVAQSGCACVLARPENRGKLGYFMSIDHAESFAPIYPGDQLICDIELPPAKGKFGKGTGVIKVGDRTVFQITLMFAIVDR